MVAPFIYGSLFKILKQENSINNSFKLDYIHALEVINLVTHDYVSNDTISKATFPSSVWLIIKK